MKRCAMIVVLLASISAAGEVLALTGEEAVAKFNNRMLSIGSMTGVVSWITTGGNSYTGTFQYLAPDKIYVKFSNPSGKIIASNGKTLWVYNPYSSVCGIQDLAKGGSGGLSGIISGYRSIATETPGGVTILLKHSERPFSEINLYLDQTYFLKRAVLRTSDGATFSLALSNVKTGLNLVPSIFSFRVPHDAQTVKNPLNMK